MSKFTFYTFNPTLQTEIPKLVTISTVVLDEANIGLQLGDINMQRNRIFHVEEAAARMRYYK